MNTEHLFPRRFTRRDFIATAAASAAALSLPSLRADEPAAKFGTGQWTYTLDPSWGKLPEGMKYGWGCGIAVDSHDRIFVTSRSAHPCVAIFDTEGKLTETWGKELGENIGYTPDQIAETAHCIYISKEGDGEYLYFTENVGGPKEKPLGKRVYKTDLNGKVLYTIGNVEAAGSASQKFDWTNPTDVAVAPNGDIYVVDGYGSQRVTRFDKNFSPIKTFGSPGTGNDQFNTCHGIWVSTLGAEPEVYIADRQNGRLQVFDLALNFKRSIKEEWVRNPCCFYQHAGHLYIPDLAAQVTIIDPKDKLVAALGDGKQVPKEEKDKRPEFIAPHALTVDSKGNLYVLEWVPYGRVRKFAHTPEV